MYWEAHNGSAYYSKFWTSDGKKHRNVLNNFGVPSQPTLSRNNSDSLPSSQSGWSITDKHSSYLLLRCSWKFLLHLDHYPIDLPDRICGRSPRRTQWCSRCLCRHLEEGLLDAPVAERAEIFERYYCQARNLIFNPKEAFWDWAMRTRALWSEWRFRLISAPSLILVNIASVSEVMVTLNFGNIRSPLTMKTVSELL